MAYTRMHLTLEANAMPQADGKCHSCAAMSMRSALCWCDVWQLWLQVVGRPPIQGIWESFYINAQCIYVCYPNQLCLVPEVLAVPCDQL